MNIGIFGTGFVAQTVGGALAAKGHEVVLGTRDVEAALARTEKGPYGNPPPAQWLQGRANTTLGSFAEAAQAGDILVNATSGAGSLPALEAAGAARLDGKILIDIANPLDFSRGFPPSLSVCNTDSLGEQIQRAFPGLKVVKVLNTLNAGLMVNPAALAGDHVLFMSGNDAGAKAEVAALLGQWFGWQARNIIDVGDISTARGTEMLLPLWVRLFAAFGNPQFNFNIVR
jgi:predicted dinucleotide-binding enzyme